MLNPPPVAGSSGRSGPAPAFDLRAIQLPPLPPADSPIVLCSHGTGPIPPAEIPKLRASLLLARTAAVERAQTCGANRAALAERVAAERNSAATTAAATAGAARDAGKGKEVERKRKRDDDGALQKVTNQESPAPVPSAGAGGRPGPAAAETAFTGVKQEQGLELSVSSFGSTGQPHRPSDARPALPGDLDAGSRTGSDAHDEDTPMGDVSTSTSAAGTPAPIPIKAPPPDRTPVLTSLAPSLGANVLTTPLHFSPPPLRQVFERPRALIRTTT